MKPSAIYLVISQIISTGLKFLIFVFLASYGGIAIAGSYTLSLAVVTPIFLFFNLGLREIYVTEKTTGLAFQHVLVMRSFYGCLAIITAVLFGLLVFPDSLNLIIWMSVYRYCEVLLDIVIAYFQRRTNAIGMATTSITFSITTYTTMALVYLHLNNLSYAVAAASLVGMAIFVVSLTIVRPWSSDSSIFPTRKKIARSFRQGIMLSLSSFTVSFATNTPVMFIETFHSTEEVGFYSAIYHITTVSNILYSSISQLELRGFALAVQEEAYDSFQKRWKKVNGFLTLGGVLGAVIVSIAGLPLFELLFKQDFSSVYPAILVMGLVICLTPSGFLLDAQMISLQKYSLQGAISTVALFLTLFFSFLLIPHLAVLGGVLVVLISLCFRNTTKYLIVKKEVRLRTVPEESIS